MDFNISGIPNREQWIKAAKAAAEHPDDFKSWDNLIHLTEHLPSLNFKVKYPVNSHSDKIVKQLVLLVYENLLINFPLLEQYWINYANWFYTFNDLTNSIETYERALFILPNSLLLWNSYLDLQLKINSNNDQMLNNFERARIGIGYHYLGSIIFDKYLKFLETNKLVKEYHLLLRKIIEIPQHDYLKYFQKFLHLIQNADLDTIKYIISKNDLQRDFKLTWNDLLKNENFHYLKTELRKKFLDLFITIQYHSWKFYYYEKNLTTHYFIPDQKITRLELQTWRSYLEYVETLNLKIATKEKEISLIKNNNTLIDTLYNRCLIPTASYQFFWIKLSNYYLNYNDVKSAKLVLLKGIYMNPVKNLKLRLRLIDLYVLSTDFDKAKCLIYESLQLLPNDLQLFCKLLEVEHFIHASNVPKLIMNKFSEINKLGNYELECQFDFLFIEMLNYSCISLDKLDQIFQKFSGKKSHYYIKAKQKFYDLYKIAANIDSDFVTDSEKKFDVTLTTKTIPENWECEYF